MNFTPAFTMTNTDCLRLVYLECRAKNATSAKVGASQVLKTVSQEWFKDSSLVIEEKYLGF